MALLTVFSFSPGKTWLHRLDARVKLAAMVMLSMAAMAANIHGLELLTLFLATVAISSRLRVIDALWQMRPMAFLFALIIVAQTLNAPDPEWHLGSLGISFTGLRLGLRTCWQLGLVITASWLFVRTTAPGQIKIGIQRLLAPWPLIPEHRVAVMTGLLMRFIPLLLEEAATLSEAHRSRGIELRRNPIFRLISLASALLRRTFLRADRLAEAMQSRCYQEQRSDPPLVARSTDGLALAILCVLCLAAILAP